MSRIIPKVVSSFSEQKCKMILPGKDFRGAPLWWPASETNHHLLDQRSTVRVGHDLNLVVPEKYIKFGQVKTC